MSLIIPQRVMAQIQAHLEAAYPDEGAGLMLGVDGDPRRVDYVITLPNSREPEARRNRYLITPQDMLVAEVEALNRGLEVLGVFHSHPDHPSEPSEYDREFALPYYSYLIVSIREGKPATSQVWRLSEDRSRFEEEALTIE